LIRDLFDDFSTNRFFPPLYQDTTDFFYRSLRPEIRWPYQENNALYEFERMVQHKAFQFPVVLSAPID